MTRKHKARTRKGKKNDLGLVALLQVSAWLDLHASVYEISGRGSEEEEDETQKHMEG